MNAHRLSTLYARRQLCMFSTLRILLTIFTSFINRNCGICTVSTYKILTRYEIFNV
jgi:hypothetical protein